MPQELHTKHHGTWKFEQTWYDNGVHIGLLVGGGYCHTSGLPIKSEAEIKKAMVGDRDNMEKALYWFRHKDEIAAQEAKRLIIIDPAGNYVFDDGSPITDPAELARYFAGNDEALKAALTWYAKHIARKEEVAKETKKLKQTKAGKTAAAVKGKKAPAKVEPKKPPPEVAEPEVALKD